MIEKLAATTKALLTSVSEGSPSLRGLAKTVGNFKTGTQGVCPVRPSTIGTSAGSVPLRAARRPVVLGALLLGLMLVLVTAGIVEAQNPLAVGNLGQSTATSTTLLKDYDVAQAFTTGSDSRGYTLTKLSVDFKTGGADASDQAYIHVYRAAVSGQPTGGSVGGTLGVPFATFQEMQPVLNNNCEITVKGFNTVKADAPVYTEFSAATGTQTLVGGIHLDPSTTYVLVFSAGLSYSTSEIRYTTSDAQDNHVCVFEGGGDAQEIYSKQTPSGWTIADSSFSRTRCTGDPCATWNSNADPLRVQILGHTGRKEYPSLLDVDGDDATEGEDDALEFVVTMEPESSKTITVKYKTRNGTAIAGSDYRSKSGTVTFAPGETKKTILVPIINDTVDDSGEHMSLEIYDPSDGASLWYDSFARGYIYNTDPDPGPVNSPPTGAPVINGTPRVGETLTADVSAIADADGMANPEFTYMWFRKVDGNTWTLACCAATTYTPRVADEGYAIYLQVWYTDDTGARESLTSDPTAPVQPETETNTPATGSPTIAGTAQVGHTLTAETTGIDDADGLTNVSYTYQWIAGTTDIDGANDASYTLTYSEVGQSIRVRVSFADDANNDESLISEPTTDVVPKPNIPATGMPTISGTVQVGETLTVDTSGISDEDGMTNPSFLYRWLRLDGETETRIEGVTDASYTLSADDVGTTIKVRVLFLDDVGSFESVESQPTPTVAPLSNIPATGAPAITGTPRVGETLTANTSTIADADGLINVSYGYQWIRSDGNNDSDIAGETAQTYELAVADQGKTIKVRVTFRDDAGNDESLTSEATEAVEAAPLPPLTVNLSSNPSSHNGTDEFTFEIRFSEEFGLSYKTLKFDAFTVTGGTTTKAQRMDKPSNIPWRIAVQPDGNGDVTVALPATTDCNAQGAICTGDGRKLSNSLSFTVNGPGG